MPANIKITVVALILSCTFSLLAVFFDGVEFEELGFGNHLILGSNLIWVIVVVWMVKLLSRRRDIRSALLIVAVIMLGSLILDFYEFGFSAAQIFYLLELMMFVMAFYFVSTKEGRAWCSV